MVKSKLYEDNIICWMHVTTHSIRYSDPSDSIYMMPMSAELLTTSKTGSYYDNETTFCHQNNWEDDSWPSNLILKHKE